MTPKVIYIVSDIDKALAFEWVASGLKERVDLIFILIGKKDTSLATFLKENGVRYYELASASRLSQCLHVFQILKKEKPDVVHTHLWQATLSGLTGAWLARVPKRIMTRHHGVLHYNEFPAGRKWDRLCNAIATNIIAISPGIKEILTEWDKASSKKISLIPHGFPVSYFSDVDDTRVDALRKKYDLKRDKVVVGVISRYVNWKGIQYIIPAFSEVIKSYPDAHLVLANAHGPYKNEVEMLLKTLPRQSYTEIEFEPDVAALYKLFSVFVHAPIDRVSEAFGQTYVEALAAGVPSVFTLSGIAPVFIKNDFNGLVVPFKDSAAISAALLTILSSPALRAKYSANGKSSVGQFSMDQMISDLVKLYND